MSCKFASLLGSFRGLLFTWIQCVCLRKFVPVFSRSFPDSLFVENRSESANGTQGDAPQRPRLASVPSSRAEDAVDQLQENEKLIAGKGFSHALATAAGRAIAPGPGNKSRFSPVRAERNVGRQTEAHGNDSTPEGSRLRGNGRRCQGRWRHCRRVFTKEGLLLLTMLNFIQLMNSCSNRRLI